MIDINELKKRVASWEEAVKWISKGWDCFEEYTHDLSYREDLQMELDEFSSKNPIPEDIENQIAKIDDYFRSLTEESNLCVWDSCPAFTYYDENNIKLRPLNKYDKKKYWFYYRWLPDCPYSWKNMDAETYQKKAYGLDFVNMTYDQLIDAVKKEVAIWDKILADEVKKQGDKL